MTATVNAEEEKTLTDEQKTVTWSASGVEGVTIDESTGVLSIPANTNTGTVTVTATSTVRDDKTGTATVRIDPELVSTSGKTTTIYVSDDYSSELGAKQTQALTTGGAVNPEDAKQPLKELVLNQNGGNWQAAAVLEFDLSSISDTSKIYSAKLKIPAGYGYQGTKDEQHNITANSITSTNTMNCGGNKDSTATTLEVNLTAAEIAKLTGTYTVTVRNVTNHTMSILSRESDSRGAYLELVEGYSITYKYVDGDSQPVSDLAVTLSDGQTGTTNASGEVTFLVAGGTDYTATTVAGAYKASTKTLENVNADATAETVTLEANSDKSITFSVANDANATIAVYTDEEKTEANKLTATSGNTYSLTQGVTYYYTVTPSEANTDTYDVYNGSVSVTSETEATLQVTLEAKTYEVGITNLPAYAKVYIGTTTESEQPVYSLLALTNEFGNIAYYSDKTTATAVYTGTGASDIATGSDFTGGLDTNLEKLPSKYVGGSKLYYKVEKGGYTTLESSLMVASTSQIDGSSMTLTGSNVLFYENYGWLVGINNKGYYSVFRNTADQALSDKNGQTTWIWRQNALRPITKRTNLYMNTDSIAADKYQFSTSIGYIGAKSGKTTHVQFIDKNNKVIGGIAYRGTSDSKAFIVAEDATPVAAGTGNTSGIRIGDFDNDVTVTPSVVTGDLTITVDTKAATDNVTIKIGDGPAVTGTVEGVGMIKRIAYGTSGDANNAMSFGAITITNLSE